MGFSQPCLTSPHCSCNSSLVFLTTSNIYLIHHLSRLEKKFKRRGTEEASSHSSVGEASQKPEKPLPGWKGDAWAAICLSVQEPTWVTDWDFSVSIPGFQHSCICCYLPLGFSLLSNVNNIFSILLLHIQRHKKRIVLFCLPDHTFHWPGEAQIFLSRSTNCDYGG